MLDSPLLFEDYIEYVGSRKHHLPKKTCSRGLQTTMAPVDIIGQDAAARKSSLQPSMLSINETIGSDKDICRICHCEGDMQLPLISPCFCAGSLKYVHQACLQQWIKSSDTKCCELCKFEFIMNTKVKPFTKWERLDLSAIEQRKVFCSITFHLVAITCVVWSLYVLIDRTSEEMKDGKLDWPFWTKLIVLAVGFTGGAVFMYVQCRMYFQLFKRWKAFNRIIFVQNAPPKDKDLPTAQDLMPVNIFIQDDSNHQLNQTKRSCDDTSCTSPLSEQNAEVGSLATMAPEDNC